MVVLLLLVGCDDGGGDGGETPVPDAAVETDEGTPTSDAEAPPPDASGADAAVVYGVLAVDPAEVDFGTVGVGGSENRMLTLRNDGEGPITVTDWNLEAPFGTSRQLPIEIPAGGNRTVLLTFSPADAGEASQELSFTVDDPDATPPTVQLRGVGGSAEAELQSERIDFGVVNVGEPAADFIVLQNTSDSVGLSVIGVAGLMPPFAIPEGQVPVNVGPGNSAMVLVQYTPEEEGTHEQAVTVQTNAGDFAVTLVGQAVRPGDLTVRRVEPAWAPNDEATTLTIHGGPFAAAPDAVEVGGVALMNVERVDDERVRGTLPAGGAPGVLDVRVEQGASFGVGAQLLVRTGPAADGSQLDAAAVQAGMIGPDGNPWRLTTDTIPAERELEIAGGTVILGEGRLDVAGVLRIGGEAAPVVFSAASREAGAWGGLRFAGAAPSHLTNVHVEYAGDGGAAIEVANASSFGNLVVRHSAGDGMTVEAGGSLAVLGGELADLAGDAMVLDPEATLFRLQTTVIRRAGWPLTGHPGQFTSPVAAGHDWAGNAHDGIGIGGEVTGVATLGNQPAGIVYQLRAPVRVAAGATWRIAAAAPLRLDGVVTVEGRLDLPTGLRVEAAPGGRLEFGGEGSTLQAAGTPADPVVFEARTPDGAPAPGSWDGIRLPEGTAIAVTRLVVRDAGADGPALTLAADFEDINGLAVEDSAEAGLALSGSGSIRGAHFAGNAEGTRITGGGGSIAGETLDAAPAVRFDPTDLCGDWDLESLVDGEAAAVTTDCQ